MGELLCTSFEPPFFTQKGVFMIMNDVTKPKPSLLLLVVAPATSLLLGLEGEYALCPLLLTFHTLEVRLLTCVAASHAGKTHKNKTKKVRKYFIKRF